ncbi:MAG: hypothetical protein AAGH76_10770 [Pseudomonadota bacterium]
MEISDLSSANLAARSLLALGESPATSRADKAPEFVNDDKSGRALEAFRQDLRATLSARFLSRFGSGVPGYANAGNASSAGDVANETLGAARRVASEAPTQAARSIVAFRASVRESATAVREAIGQRDDISDIDDAVARVDRGLTALENDFSNVRESSASVLAVESRTNERSTIRIRTQEGDIVRLDLRQRERLSATAAAASVPGGSAELTEIDFSSRTGIRLSVDGDLNDDELAAISNVVEQASRIADDFFGGDLGAAFANANALDVDAEQLARVNLRFRFSETTQVALANERTTTAAPSVVAPAIDTPQSPPQLVIPAITPAPAQPEAPQLVIPAINTAPSRPEAPLQLREAPNAASGDVEPVAQTDVPESAAEAPAPIAVDNAAVDDSADEAGPPLGSDYLNQFFNLVGDFLRSVSDGFPAGDVQSATLQYSESIKLTLLQETLKTVAQPAEQDAANLASDAIELVVNTSARSDAAAS